MPSQALDAARGMCYLHARSVPVVHRDLKSPNLLVTNVRGVAECVWLCSGSRVKPFTWRAVASLPRRPTAAGCGPAVPATFCLPQDWQVKVTDFNLRCDAALRCLACLACLACPLKPAAYWSRGLGEGRAASRRLSCPSIKATPTWSSHSSLPPGPPFFSFFLLFWKMDRPHPGPPPAAASLWRTASRS